MLHWTSLEKVSYATKWMLMVRKQDNKLLSGNTNLHSFRNLDFSLPNPLNISSINVGSSEEASQGLGKRAKTTLQPRSQQKVTTKTGAWPGIWSCWVNKPWINPASRVTLSRLARSLGTPPQPNPTSRKAESSTKSATLPLRHESQQPSSIRFYTTLLVHHRNATPERDTTATSSTNRPGHSDKISH